ncbi:flagellar protein FlaG [Clostridium sp. CF012]|nr:flagellar protein FlaG [Clostridium sp. CF012]
MGKGSNTNEIKNSKSEKDNYEKEVENAVNKINNFLMGEDTHLEYQKHDVLNQIIIRIVNNKTNEVIKEIPSEKILDMVVEMCEKAGVFVDKKA